MRMYRTGRCGDTTMRGKCKPIVEGIISGPRTTTYMQRQCWHGKNNDSNVGACLLWSSDAEDSTSIGIHVPPKQTANGCRGGTITKQFRERDNNADVAKAEQGFSSFLRGTCFVDL